MVTKKKNEVVQVAFDADGGPTYGAMLPNTVGGNAVPQSTGEAVDTSYGANATNVGATEPQTSFSGTYGEYLQNAGNTYKDIYTETTAQIDAQNKAALDALDAQKADDLSYNANRQQILVDALVKAKESGTTLAKEQYDLLMSLTEEQKATVYKAAEAQREEEYRLAEIERERGVVDARTSYAQNMAGYGANAEQMGRMGLTGSGYSDYVNAQAYATQRSETQAANAQSEAAKREARYAEEQAKLDADLSYSQNQYNAKSQYSKDLYDVNTTYDQGLRDANLQRNDADHEANRTHREGTLEANQTAAAQRLEAGISYREGMLELDGKSAEYTEDRLKTYTEILADANNGAYTKEQVEALAKAYGLSEEQTKALKEATESSLLNETDRAENNEYIKEKIASGEYSESDIEDAYISGYITKEDKDTHTAEYSKQIQSEVITKNVKFNNDGGWWIFGSTKVGEKGNNFSVRADGSDTIYRVQYGAAVDDANVFEAAKNVDDDQVFGFRNKIYIKKNGEVYSIEARDNSFGEKSDSGYNALYDAIFGTK